MMMIDNNIKTNYRKRRKKTPPNPALDLFGEVPVSVSDIHAWVLVVAPRWYGSRRMDNYVRLWNVAEKIQYAKMEGRFEEIRARAHAVALENAALAAIFCRRSMGRYRQA